MNGSDKDILEMWSVQPDVGNGYVTPPTLATESGRQVDLGIDRPDLFRTNPASASDSTFAISEYWSELNHSVGNDEFLVGVFVRRLFGSDTVQAVMMADVTTLLDFESQVDGERMRRVGYFAVKQTLL
jgi:hypothetical protein